VPGKKHFNERGWGRDRQEGGTDAGGAGWAGECIWLRQRRNERLKKNRWTKEIFRLNEHAEFGERSPNESDEESKTKTKGGKTRRRLQGRLFQKCGTQLPSSKEHDDKDLRNPASAEMLKGHPAKDGGSGPKDIQRGKEIAR